MIEYKNTFRVDLIIKNASSSEDLFAGDTLLIHLPLQQQGQYTGAVLDRDLPAGSELGISLTTLQNNNTSDEDQTFNFCVSVIGPAQTRQGGSWENPNYQDEGCSMITLKPQETNNISSLFAGVESICLYPNPATAYTHLAVEMAELKLFACLLRISRAEQSGIWIWVAYKQADPPR